MGRWMSRQQKPVKTPSIIKDGDDENRVKLKRMIGQMICAEPSHRCTIQHVCDFLDMFSGMYIVIFVAHKPKQTNKQAKQKNLYTATDFSN